jgi:hypothetical protein
MLKKAGHKDFLPFQTDTLVYWRRTLPIFRELGFAPINVKFPPITAPHVLYNVKKNPNFS